MKLLWSAALSLVLGLLVFSGCASGAKLGGISVNIIDLQAADATLLETRVALSLRYINENVLPIAISGSKHKLYLNGDYIGQSVSNESLGLPQLGTATQTVTLLINNVALLQRLRTMADATQASYTLESTVFILAGEEKLEVKSKNTGAISLKGLTAR